MKRIVTNLVALAVAFTVAPAMAEEPTQGVKRARDAAVAEDASPSATTAPVNQAVERLQRLRLHPGEDSFDVAETARKRPHGESD
ncbi:MAG TPA: hypothetical protein VEM57_06370 [Candidatus Binatus sp.]|nr:hypothetical protein [Candidatus Binatus sp.]